MDFSHIEPISRAPYPYTELQEKCLRDLETTDAKQATGRLERINDGVSGFCCLGRFCVVAEAPRRVDDGGNIIYGAYEDANSARLPKELQEALKLDCLGGFKRSITMPHCVPYYSLSQLNDCSSFSFKDIAAYIRHDPWNVFKDEPPAETSVASEVAA